MYKIINVVELELKKLSDPDSSDVFWFSGDHYDEDSLLTGGNPEIYPAVNGDISYTRSVGRYSSIFNSTSINLFANVPLSKLNITLNNLRKEYITTKGICRVYTFVQSAKDQLITYDEDIHLRYTGNITSFYYNEVDNTISVNVNDRWFKADTKLKYKFNKKDFPLISDDLDGEFRPIVFSNENETVVIPGHVVSSGVVNNKLNMKLYAGFKDSVGLYYNAGISDVYIKNRNTELTNKEYIKTNLIQQGTVEHFLPYDLSSGWYTDSGCDIKPLHSWELGAVQAPVNVIGNTDYGCVLTHAAVAAVSSGIYEEDLGDLKVTITKAKQIDGIFQPDTVLATAVFSQSGTLWSGTKQVLVAPLSEPVTLANTDNIFITQSWTNSDATASGTVSGIRLADSGYISYTRNTVTSGGKERPKFLMESNVKIGLDLLCLSGSSVLTAESAPYPYQSYNIATTTGVAGVTPDTTPAELADKLEFKLAVSGLKEVFGNHTIPATSQQITNPCSIISFLCAPDFLWGLGLSDVELADSRANAMLKSGYKHRMSFAIENEISVADLITDIARQGRLVIYTLNDGRIALEYPQYKGVCELDYDIFDEELEVINFNTMPSSEVVNYFNNNYNIDRLNIDKDIRSVNDQKTIGQLILNPNESSAGDVRRMKKLETSEKLYGAIENIESLNKYQKEFYALQTQKYWADRYSKLNSRLIFELPKINTDYLNIKLFDWIRVNSSKLPNTEGTGDLTVIENSIKINTYENEVAVKTVRYGNVIGQVVGISETLTGLIISIETSDSF